MDLARGHLDDEVIAFHRNDGAAKIYGLRRLRGRRDRHQKHDGKKRAQAHEGFAPSVVGHGVFSPSFDFSIHPEKKFPIPA
jgi:hypothetical protein